MFCVAAVSGDKISKAVSLNGVQLSMKIVTPLFVHAHSYYMYMHHALLVDHAFDRCTLYTHIGLYILKLQSGR